MTDLEKRLRDVALRARRAARDVASIGPVAGSQGSNQPAVPRPSAVAQLGQTLRAKVV